MVAYESGAFERPVAHGGSTVLQSRPSSSKDSFLVARSPSAENKKKKKKKQKNLDREEILTNY